MSSATASVTLTPLVWFRGQRVSRETAVIGFLTDRMLAKQRHSDPRCYGVSSNALALYGVGRGPRPQTPGWSDSPNGGCWSGEECGSNYPHDDSDLLACEITYRMAPRHVQERMLPVLDEFRRWVDHGLNRYGVAKPYAQPTAEEDVQTTEGTIPRRTERTRR